MYTTPPGRGFKTKSMAPSQSECIRHLKGGRGSRGEAGEGEREQGEAGERKEVGGEEEPRGWEEVERALI